MSDKLTRRDFEIRAAGHFLSEGELSMRKCLITMEADCEPGESLPEGVIGWQPFENETVGEMLTNIYNLADHFEDIYEQGLNYKEDE